jgi:hypothetical protein
MKGFYTESKRGKYALYIPFNLIVYSNYIEKLNVRYDPGSLEKMTILINNKIIPKVLKNKNRFFKEIDIPDIFLREFQNFCNRKNNYTEKNIFSKAIKIFEYAQDIVKCSSFLDCEKNLDNDGDENICEDIYNSYWWQRGEEWNPNLRGDSEWE